MYMMSCDFCMREFLVPAARAAELRERKLKHGGVYVCGECFITKIGLLYEPPVDELQEVVECG